MKISVFLDHLTAMAQAEGITVAEALTFAKRLGIDYVEADANAFFGHEAKWQSMFADSGLKVGGMYCFFDFAHADQTEQADAFLALGVKMGADSLMALPGFLAEGDDPDVILNRMADALNTLSVKAASMGLSLVLEDFDASNAVFGDLKGLKWILSQVPRLGCVFDTGNFIYHGDDIRAAYDALCGRIRHVHLKDRALTKQYGSEELRCVTGQLLYPAPVGSGCLPMETIVKLLRSDGYDGIWAIEHFGAADMRACISESVRWLKSI